MVRYTLLRFLIFFGTLSLLWLLGLRSEAERPWLVIGAATLSMVISTFIRQQPSTPSRKAREGYSQKE